MMKCFSDMRYKITKKIFQPVGCEKPVAVPTFTSDTAPIKEVIQNNFNGILADFYDIDLLVKNVNLILNNPENYSNIRTSARKTINEKFELKKL